ncbi:glycogen synthase GlgA [Aestuariibacter halophilus]|uniref:Glycogen synthase n=1 Tax=Fluctibacter halophilus TaxID=226011 RepID=A0ABS8GCZ7_9ALTE|nr:glycogen synthase GlgA [Aestuariibacter halophilus]MCC2617664.1 glycogen synthase GlgA [Aestuariibacter halophilus]
MKILFVVSEVEDLAKTGGLADVAKSLPISLIAMGHDVRIVKPYYKSLADKYDLDDCCPRQQLYAHKRRYEFGVKALSLEKVPVYCVDYPEYFNRQGLYSDGYHAYGDNAERFAFFSAAALQAAKALDFHPDIVHCNDWHTAMVPFLMQADNSGYFQHTKSVLTIHNGAFQGTHEFADIPFLQPYEQLQQQLDGNALNYLRMGIRYATRINAVSPNYAQELLTPLGSHNLYNEFQARRSAVSGILNGCDYQQWDPATDPYIPANYTSDNLDGKAQCKQALQQECGLPANDSVPVIGMVCRLTEQKGFGYILPIMANLLQHNVQLVIVGTGDPSIADALKTHRDQHPDKFRFIEDFSVKLAHLVEAGSDFFLMPSLFEPCGLNQMYSLAYGTLPVVRAVGGLKDTVLDLHSAPEYATGFMFEHPDSTALLNCLRRALLFYHEYPDLFAAMRIRAMNTRFTWQDAAVDYERLYTEAQANG